ncbi:MAG: SH3 domain-containing protein [Agarilytica sp.]
MLKIRPWLLAFVTLCCAQVADAGIWDIFKRDGVNLVVTVPYVDMRAGPGRGFPVFHSLEKDEKIRVFKRRTDWFKVESSDGVTGWVHRADLTETQGALGEEVSFAAIGRQDYIDRRLEFGFLGGDFGGTESMTTYLAFHLTQNISFEAKHTETFSSVANNKLTALHAVHRPFPGWRVSPFFTMGAGEIEISPSSSLVQPEDRTNPIYTVGGGTFIYLSRRFLGRLEYNNHTLITSRNVNEEVEEWKLGFSVFF